MKYGRKGPAGAKIRRERVTHEFPAEFDAESRVLLLGSIPSPRSRETGFYYGHPQNRFWRVLAAVFGDPVPLTIPEKKALLRKHRVALWDVLESCTIVGAGDATIEDAVPNRIAELLGKTKIERIFCTGAAAHALYRKHCERETGIEAVRLPSTSPANCAVSFEELVEEWGKIRD